MGTRIPQLTAAGTLTQAEQMMLSQLSTSVTITAGTISAQASDNSYNDSGSGFVAAGFTVGDAVRVTGFTGNTANNINCGIITVLTAGKMTIGGTDGDVIVDDAAGESVTITKWLSRRTPISSLMNVGKHAIPIMAGAMRPSATGGCAELTTDTSGSNQPDIVYLAFDATTEEYAQFAIPMPASWNESTVTFQALWSHDATTTNFGVVWALQGVAVSDDDTIAASYGTAQTVSDTGGTTDDLYVSPESSAITIAGTPGARDMVYFRLYRKAADGSDTLAVDARLIGIVLYITTDAVNDA